MDREVFAQVPPSGSERISSEHSFADYVRISHIDHNGLGFFYGTPGPPPVTFSHQITMYFAQMHRPSEREDLNLVGSAVRIRGLSCNHQRRSVPLARQVYSRCGSRYLQVWLAHRGLQKVSDQLRFAVKTDGMSASSMGGSVATSLPGRSVAGVFVSNLCLVSL